jgi:hypothetical protein
MSKPTYDELLAENKWLRDQCQRTERQVLEELIQLLMADDKPLIRVKPEAYEYRIYELELDYMLTLADTPESKEKYELVERVTANYHRAYPGRPLNPKPRPVEGEVFASAPYFGSAPKQRKPYTRKPKAA